MDLPNIPLFDDLLPPTGTQPPQLTKDGTISHRILEGSASAWSPALRHRAGRVDVGIEGKRHSQPFARWVEASWATIAKLGVLQRHCIRTRLMRSGERRATHY